MLNTHILERLRGIHQMLMGAYQSGKSMSSSSKGSEREAFIGGFLSEVLTPQFRFGRGDATDQEGRRSGQLDVVVEYPFVPSLPIVGTMEARLYLAEGVAAVIEVKSDVSGQWPEVEGTVSRLSPLQRKYGAGISFGAHATPHIPFFAVGYTGWKTIEPLVSRLAPGKVEGILVIDSLLFASTDAFLGARCAGHPAALWAFIASLHQAAGMGGSTALGVPIQYVVLPGLTTRCSGRAALAAELDIVRQRNGFLVSFHSSVARGRRGVYLHAERAFRHFIASRAIVVSSRGAAT